MNFPKNTANLLKEENKKLKQRNKELKRLLLEICNYALLPNKYDLDLMEKCGKVLDE